MEYQLVENLSEQQIQQLHNLYQNEFWSKGRKLNDIHTMLQNSDMIFAFADQDDKLIAFARLLTDYVFKATVYDLIVAPSCRDQGYGKKLMDTILEHPALQQVNHIDLHCLPEMFDFYRRWDFTTDLNGVQLMRRSKSKR
jgi:ribosomal protein S18 acetylase RimI-like enzyme